MPGGGHKKGKKPWCVWERDGKRRFGLFSGFRRWNGDSVGSVGLYTALCYVRFYFFPAFEFLKCIYIYILFRPINGLYHWVSCSVHRWPLVTGWNATLLYGTTGDSRLLPHWSNNRCVAIETIPAGRVPAFAICNPLADVRRMRPEIEWETRRARVRNKK